MPHPVLILQLGDDGPPGPAEHQAGVQGRINFAGPNANCHYEKALSLEPLRLPEHVRRDGGVGRGGLRGHRGEGAQGPLGGVGEHVGGHHDTQDLQHDKEGELHFSL